MDKKKILYRTAFILALAGYFLSGFYQISPLIFFSLSVLILLIYFFEIKGKLQGMRDLRLKDFNAYDWFRLILSPIACFTFTQLIDTEPMIKTEEISYQLLAATYIFAFFLFILISLKNEQLQNRTKIVQ